MTASEYNRCVSLHADSLFRYAQKLLRRAEDAEDTVQNAFEALWRQHGEVDAAKAKSWLYSTTHHKAIDFFRKNKRMDYPEQLPERAIGNSSAQFEAKEAVGKGLMELSEIQQSVLLLRDYEGYSYEEIGAMTGLSESQVKVYIFRARKKMQDFFTTAEITA